MRVKGKGREIIVWLKMHVLVPMMMDEDGLTPLEKLVLVGTKTV